MRKKANKERLPLLFAALLGALLLSNCGYRPEGVEAVQPLSDVPAAAAALPEETAAPQGKTYTVTYRVNGAETTELVAEGGSVQNAPEFMASENCAIVAWKNANGTKVDIRTAPVYADAVYEAVPGPALRREGAYIAAGNDGLFHPLDKFTRSDAARAVYALLDTKPTGETFLKDVTTHAKCYTAATTLVTAGYMTLNEGRFYPDVAITRADLAALLEKVFSPAAVERALAGMTDETPFPSQIRVLVEGEEALAQALPDDPADANGVLSWHYQRRQRYLEEAGSYGYLLTVPVSARAMDSARARGSLLPARERGCVDVGADGARGGARLQQVQRQLRVVAADVGKQRAAARRVGGGLQPCIQLHTVNRLPSASKASALQLVLNLLKRALGLFLHVPEQALFLLLVRAADDQRRNRAGDQVHQQDPDEQLRLHFFHHFPVAPFFV